MAGVDDMGGQITNSVDSADNLQDLETNEVEADDVQKDQPKSDENLENSWSDFEKSQENIKKMESNLSSLFHSEKGKEAFAKSSGMEYKATDGGVTISDKESGVTMESKMDGNVQIFSKTSAEEMEDNKELEKELEVVADRAEGINEHMSMMKDKYHIDGYYQNADGTWHVERTFPNGQKGVDEMTDKTFMSFYGDAIKDVEAMNKEQYEMYEKGVVGYEYEGGPNGTWRVERIINGKPDIVSLPESQFRDFYGDVVSVPEGRESVDDVNKDQVIA